MGQLTAITDEQRTVLIEAVIRFQQELLGAGFNGATVIVKSPAIDGKTPTATITLGCTCPECIKTYEAAFNTFATQLLEPTITKKPLN